MICIIAPYPKLKETADSLASSLPFPIKTVIGDLEAGLAQARSALEEGAILVSRGGTAKLIRESLNVDVIDIGVSESDLLAVLKPFIGGKGLIAVAGFRALTEHAERLCKALDIRAVFVPVDHQADMPLHMERLSHLDLACIVGDMISIRWAASLDRPLKLVESGPDAVREALDKAAVVERSLRYREESEIRLSAVLNNVQEAIFAYDRRGQIVQLNQTARRLLGLAEDSVFPQAKELLPLNDIRRALTEKRGTVGKLIEINGRRAAMDLSPIIVRNSAEGAVAIVREVEQIQAIETKVRRQLHEKGLVAKRHFEDIAADSKAMASCLDLGRQYARSAGNILIYGETGTGKEMLAQSIHNGSAVRDGPFVAINCGALPPSLLESELFGYVEGAFTGAGKGGKAGLFELAHGGSIFLDEINELDVQLQGKLLRVLQEKEVMRLGDVKVIPVSFRLIVASNVPLGLEMERGKLRRDLFYRLKVLDISIPPLRERREDILPLFREFSVMAARRDGDLPPPVPPERLKAALLEHGWPGNVRELENVAEKWTILGRLIDGDEAARQIAGALLESEEGAGREAGDKIGCSGSLAEIEERVVSAVLESEGGNISRAAQRLRIDRQTLRRKLGRKA